MFASYHYSTYDLNLSPIILNRKSDSYVYPIFVIHYTQNADKTKFEQCLENIKKSFSQYKFNKSCEIDCLKPTIQIPNQTIPIVNLSENLQLKDVYTFINKEKLPDWCYNSFVENFINATKGCIFISDTTTYLAPCLLTRSILTISDTTDHQILKHLCNRAGTGMDTIPSLEGTLSSGMFRGVHKGIHWSKYISY